MSIDRRTALATLLAGAGWLDGAAAAPQDRTAPPDPSLYIPKAHIVGERAFLHDFMEAHAFVELVTATPTLRITHIPTIVDRSRGRLGAVLGHISAQNPQRASLEAGHSAVVVFRGPHSYISPTWYANQASVVPTWNFGVVHASGRPRAITDHDEAHALLARLIATNERAVGATGYDFNALPDDYVRGMMKGIVGFMMEIEALEGKFKLGQERSEGDRQGVLARLRGTPYTERSIYDLTESFYRAPPK